MTETNTKTETKTIDRAEVKVVTVKQIANFLVNRFNGIVSAFEATQNKVGAIFATIEYHKPIKMRKFHRTAKTADGKKVANPYSAIFAVGKMTVQFNSIWENKVANQVERKDGVKTDWTPDKKRSNGIENYLDSRVVCHKIKETVETFYLNYSPIEYLGKTVYVDENGTVVDYSEIAEYHQTKSKVSKENEAKKHGLTVETDVYIQQMKIENMTNVAIFKKNFKITKEEIKPPVSAS